MVYKAIRKLFWWIPGCSEEHQAQNAAQEGDDSDDDADVLKDRRNGN